MSSAIRARDYQPRRPALHLVPKKDGRQRELSVFPVADNALSALVFRRLMLKNRSRLSGHTYAYRDDVNTHDLIEYLQVSLGRHSRLFVAEYDFSRFFDTIDHDHVRKTIRDGGFVVSPTEMAIVEAFMSAPLPARDATSYAAGSPSHRDCGLPQGTSISLFLGNIAAAPLDWELERLGVDFVRYADDTLIWSSSYSDIGKAVDTVHSLSERMGVDLNVDKSHGISVLELPGWKSEMRSKHVVEFVGYNVSLRTVALKDSTLTEMKSHIRRLAYFNLLAPVLDGTFQLSQVDGDHDADYIVFLMQLRRYLCGDLQEREISQAINGAPSERRYWGILSNFPLINDETQLRGFDEWLRREVWQTLRRRYDHLQANKDFKDEVGTLPRPGDQYSSPADLAAYVPPAPADRLPSVVRIAHAFQAVSLYHGPRSIGHSFRQVTHEIPRH